MIKTTKMSSCQNNRKFKHVAQKVRMICISRKKWLLIHDEIFAWCFQQSTKITNWKARSIKVTVSCSFLVIRYSIKSASESWWWVDKTGESLHKIATNELKNIYCNQENNLMSKTKKNVKNTVKALNHVLYEQNVHTMYRDFKIWLYETISWTFQ